MDTIACHLAPDSKRLSPSSTLHSLKNTLPLIFSLCDEEDVAVIQLEVWVGSTEMAQCRTAMA